jgi:hypothetical protein
MTSPFICSIVHTQAQIDEESRPRSLQDSCNVSDIRGPETTKQLKKKLERAELPIKATLQIARKPSLRIFLCGRWPTTPSKLSSAPPFHNGASSS